MGSASSQLKPTEPVTPSQSEVLPAKNLSEIELETQPRPGLPKDFCPVQNILQDKNTSPSYLGTPDNSNAIVRDNYRSGASGVQADMAKKNRFKPATLAAYEAERECGQDVSFESADPNTQLRQEMILSQQQQDKRDAQAGEDRQDESPAKKKKERKKKRRALDDVDALLEQAGAEDSDPAEEVTEPAKPTQKKKRKSKADRDAQAAELAMAPDPLPTEDVAESATQTKTKKRKSKADKDAEAEVAETEAGTGAAGAGWQTVNGSGNDNADDDNDNDKETEKPGSKKRKRKSKAATDDVDSTPKAKKRKSNATGTPRPSGEGFAGLPKSGAFTQIEVELIAGTIDDFRQANSLTESAFSVMVQEGVNKSVDLKGLLRDLLDILPNRNSQAMRRFLERKYHNAKRGPWNSDEDEELRAAFAEHPNEWKKIAARLGRMAEDCRDRWRNHAQYSHDQRNKDIWTPAEEQELLDAIEVCIQRMKEDGSLPQDVNASDVPDDTIQWKVVSEMMDGKRNRLQCSYKWKKLQYRAWREQQAAAGTLPPRKKPVFKKSIRKWRSDEKVTVEDEDAEAEIAPQNDNEDENENENMDEEVDEGPAVEEVEVGEPSPEPEYRDDNLDGISRTPEDSDERHARWRERYDVGDWYSMLREMLEVYNVVSKSDEIIHHRYWEVVERTYDHGNWDNDDRARSLDRCCRGLTIPKTGLGDEIRNVLVVLEQRSRTRDLERTIMGRQQWPWLTKDKQYVSPDSSISGAAPRRASETSRTPAPTEAMEVDQPEEVPAVENQPIDVDNDQAADVPPAATLDEDDPTFWDPVSPPTQPPKLVASKKTPRVERAEAGPAGSSSTKKRASYGKMSKHKWTPAKSFYEDENDPIEDSQAVAAAEADAPAGADEAENATNAAHATMEDDNAGAGTDDNVVAENAAEVEPVTTTHADKKQPANVYSFRPFQYEEDAANDLRPFDEDSLDARGADDVAPAANYVIHEPAPDHNSTDEEEEESKDSSDVDEVVDDMESPMVQPRNEEGQHNDDAALAHDDEEEMREWRIRNLNTERDAAAVTAAEDAVDVAEAGQEDESSHDVDDSPAASVQDDDDDELYDVIRVAGAKTIDKEAAEASDEEAESVTYNSDKENNSVATGAIHQHDKMNHSDEEQEQGQSYSVIMAEPELGSPSPVQPSQTVVQNTQVRTLDSRSSSPISTSSEEGAKDEEQPKSSVVPVTQTETETQASQSQDRSKRKAKATGRVNRGMVKEEPQWVPESDEDVAIAKKGRRVKAARSRRKRRDEDLDLGSVNGWE